MKLTGLQIFKYLPGGKKQPEANCKKCGFPTCMAFSMKLAKGEASINDCEYASDDLKMIFEEATQFQQKEITFGPAKKRIKTGNEIVMFRHDKKFVNPTCLGIRLKSSDKNFESKLIKIKDYTVERIGESFGVDTIALCDTDETFVQKAQAVAFHEIPLILMSDNYNSLKEILESIKDSQPLIYAQNIEIDKLAELQAKFGVPVVIDGDSPEKLTENSSTALENGIENIVLSLNKNTPGYLIQNLTYIRRLAIEEKFKPFGFPVITFQKDVEGFSKDPLEQGILGATLVCKYSNIVILDDFNEAVYYALLTLRQNIYTDPEKPLQIEPKVYPLGDVDENSPVIVTTNFALTYFTVAAEIESCGIPSYLVVTPSDGMSVLTAWSADKFNGQIIAKTFKEFEIDKLVKHKELIIPGYVSSLKAEIEEEMPPWKVIIGSNEAVDIADFLKNYLKNFTIVKN